MDYEFAPVGVDDKSIKEITELLRITFPKAKHFSEKFIEWEYRDNPDGQIVGYNAYHKSALVAHYVIQPMLANFNGKSEKGLLSLNTATHPEHQGKKLFTTLADLSYKLAATQGYGFVIGVANQNSTHGFIKKLGFQLIGKLDAKLGRGKIYKTSHCKIEYERTWTEASLKWRLSDPAHTYRQDKNIIYAVTDSTGIEANLYELSNNHTFLKNNGGANFRPIKLWIGIDSNIDWKKSFYFDVPAKLRPSPLNLIFKDLTSASRQMDGSKVKFSALDFDAY